MKAFAPILVALLVLAGAQQSRATTIYDNSANDQTNRLSGTSGFQFGDEVNLTLASTDRFMTGFDFQFYATNTTSLTIDVQLRYNDGPTNSFTAGAATPGTLIYEFLGFPLSDTPRSTLNFNAADLDAYDGVFDGGTLLTADSLTLLVTFNYTGGDAGVDLYDPPVAGSSFNDYWINDGGTWKLVTNNTFSVVNFGMRIEAIPEPSTFALFVLGGLMTFWSRRFWSRK